MTKIVPINMLNIGLKCHLDKKFMHFGNAIMLKFNIFAYMLNLRLFLWKIKNFGHLNFHIAANTHAYKRMTSNYNNL